MNYYKILSSIDKELSLVTEEIRKDNADVIYLLEKRFILLKHKDNIQKGLFNKTNKCYVR